MSSLEEVRKYIEEAFAEFGKVHDVTVSAALKADRFRENAFVKLRTAKYSLDELIREKKETGHDQERNGNGPS